jgi:outer membrane protein OmpA-like peptidoglycan-associated protein
LGTDYAGKINGAETFFKKILAIGFVVNTAKPLATNDTDDGRQLNRRVKFMIVKN